MPTFAWLLTSAVILAAAPAGAAPHGPAKAEIAAPSVIKVFGCARGFHLDPVIGKCVRNGRR